jgi:hypothetical protein
VQARTSHPTVTALARIPASSEITPPVITNASLACSGPAGTASVRLSSSNA